MASLHLLYVLATLLTVAIATLPSEARKTNKFPIHPTHRHTPPSAAKKHGHPAAAPSPATVESALSPVAYPGFYDTCLSKVSDRCGSELYRGVFENDDHVSATCCQEMVALGRRCHKGIVRGTVEIKGLKNVDMVKVEDREIEVWQDCVLITNLIKVGEKTSI